MNLDGNKTPLTHRVTATAAGYLDGLGCKPVETEVPIGPGWTADVASYWYPTRTEAKRFDRILLPLGLQPGPLTVVVEVKTTLGDFSRDTRKFTAKPPAHICMIAFPRGMIRGDVLPTGWYGLETSTAGTKLRKVHRKHGGLHEVSTDLSVDFVAEVGIRRDHRTRYAATRDWLRAYRAEDRDRKQAYSAARLLDGLASWLQHKGWKPERRLAELLPELGVKKCPQYAEKAVAFYESLRAELGKTT